MKLKNLIIAFLLGAALAAGIWTAMNLQRAAAELRSATVLPAPAELPEFALLDHNGQAIDRSVFEGHWNLVFFGFTHCPDICPITLQILSAAKTKLAEAGFSPLPRIVLVSVDPARDTPEKMAQYISAFGEGNLGITGDIDELIKLTGGIGIYFQRQDGDEDNYSVDHSSVVIVINPAGEFHALFSGTHAVEDFVHDLPLIVAAADKALPPLVVSDVEITQALPGMNMRAGYLALTNNSAQSIRITGVSSPQFDSIEIHESVIENEIARMRPVSELVLAAGETLRLQRGGLHLMMRGSGEHAGNVTLNLFEDNRLLLTFNTTLLPTGT